MTPWTATVLLWVVLAVSWFAAASWSSRAAKRPAMGSEALYRIVTVAGALLLFIVHSNSYRGSGHLWRVEAWQGWLLFAAAVAGFAFCWWARLHLGRLWSGWVTKKADHRVVDTGPYAIVRHPIYTGIILAAFATAILKGTVTALLGAAVMTLGYWIKATLEERFLRRELGEGAYDAYRRRVPMLVPFGPKAA